jgi:zinc D-Ala-D-Ala carboxypeptidase
MTHRQPARTARRRPQSTVAAALVIVGVALLGVLRYQSLTASSSTATSLLAGAPPTHRPRVPDGPSLAGLPHDGLHRDRLGALGEADGVIPDGVTVFDDGYPGVANLDPALLGALRRAATDAAGDGVEFSLHSGWRSRRYQEQLLREAISTYGSVEEAARWVATPDTSAHVSGDAVDIDSSLATAWLSEHGAEYGLCQIYRSEPWHYELRPLAVDHGCPSMYADPTHDPRMQQ